MKSAFDKIAAGMQDAIAYAQGDQNRGRVAVPVNVKAIRRAVKLTQEQFAETYHVPLGSLRDWEQGRYQPDAASRTLLAMIAAEPDGVRAIIDVAFPQGV